MKQDKKTLREYISDLEGLGLKVRSIKVKYFVNDLTWKYLTACDLGETYDHYELEIDTGTKVVDIVAVTEW